jgi:hypothetical protein
MSHASSGLKNKRLTGCYLLCAGFLLGLFFDLKEGTCLSETMVGFNRLHGAISHKIGLVN